MPFVKGELQFHAGGLDLIFNNKNHVHLTRFVVKEYKNTMSSNWSVVVLEFK